MTYHSVIHPETREEIRPQELADMEDVGAKFLESILCMFGIKKTFYEVDGKMEKIDVRAIREETANQIKSQFERDEQKLEMKAKAINEFVETEYYVKFFKDQINFLKNYYREMNREMNRKAEEINLRNAKNLATEQAESLKNNKEQHQSQSSMFNNVNYNSVKCININNSNNKDNVYSEDYVKDLEINIKPDIMDMDRAAGKFNDLMNNHRYYCLIKSIL